MVVDVGVMLVVGTVSEKNILPSGSKRVRAAPSKFRTSEYNPPKTPAKVLASLPLTARAAQISTASRTFAHTIARTHSRASTH